MMPQSRDRCPRLSTHLPFHDILIDNIPSFGGAWGGFLFAVIWRTDEGVCPYCVVLSSIKGTPFSNQGGRFLAMKRASLHIEESLSWQ